MFDRRKIIKKNKQIQKIVSQTACGPEWGENMDWVKKKTKQNFIYYYLAFAYVTNSKKRLLSKSAYIWFKFDIFFFFVDMMWCVRAGKNVSSVFFDFSFIIISIDLIWFDLIFIRLNFYWPNKKKKKKKRCTSMK